MTKEKNEIPLNAYLARSGLGSRRAVVEHIKKGLVTVNDEVVKEPGHKIQPGDVVRYRDKIFREEKKVYILLNKPKGYVTTAADERGRKTVIDIVAKASKERLYPIGRLDRDTTGLIIITNDGYLSQKLAHPRNKVPKTYYVILDRIFTAEDMQALRHGLSLEDGKAFVDKAVYPKGRPRNHVVVEIHSGKNRIIKRMFHRLGYKVVGLDRTNFATLTKKNLPVGHWRMLTLEEVYDLVNFEKE